MLRTVIAIFTLMLASLNTAHALETKIIESNGMVFWTESFGNQKNPTILLIMGSGGQGLLWPQEFCEQLADKGYHVIRFDNRDTGLSSSIDFKTKSYNLLDMAQDSLFILDDYKIQKAHIVGVSMGGAVATLFAAHYPERTNSLVLMATTTDMRPVFDALQGKESQSSLSKPSQALLDSAKQFSNPPNTIAEKVQAFLVNARINHGAKIPVDEKLAHQIALQHTLRAQNPAGATNHFQAIQASYELHQKATPQVKVATLIIHGDQDPVFPLDHAYALQKAIKNAKLSIMPGMGHGLLNAALYQPVINKIDEGIKLVR
jgi:pimeloyl-ACP methyl ester carboxylesterase